MARRRSRRNSFKGHPLLHRWAALKGHRRSRKSRRTRRNAGSIAASIKSLPRAASTAFHKKPIMDATAIVGGSAATAALAAQLTHHFPQLASHKALSVITKLVSAGVIGKLVAPRVPYVRGYSNAVFTGGVLAGVIEALRAVVPSHYFPSTGLGEDMDGLSWGDHLQGLSDWFVGPYLASYALPNTDGGFNRDPYSHMRMGHGLPRGHMGSFLHVGQPEVTLNGLADSLHVNQPISGTGHSFHNHHPMMGFADLAVAEEMSMQS